MSETFSQAVSILVVEDDPGDFGLVRAYLRLAGLATDSGGERIIWAKTLAEGSREAGLNRFDIVLLDLSLPDSSGIATVQAMRAALPEAPIVVLTGQDDNELADAALQAGAQDYLVKGQFENDALKRAVRHAILRNNLEAERKKAEEKIKDLLAEKELLLKEVHHRIKNNMNTIVSLLVLQATRLKNPEAVAALKDSQSRVLSMMVLYDKLYRSHSFMEVSFKEYLINLIEEIAANFENRDRVKVEMQIEDFIINTKVLSTLGIIVNELITNAMKYAFSGRDKGLLTVSATLKDKTVTLIIKDNGIGLPETVNIEASTGFGLELINMLTKQLKGNIKIERSGGSTKDLPSGQYVDTTPSVAGAKFILEFKI